MRADDARVGRLHRVDAVRRRGADVVAEVGELIEVEPREVARAAERRDRRRAEAERRRIEEPSCWRTLGSWNRDHPPRTSSTDDPLIV